MQRITFVVKRIEKYEKGNYTYFRINIPQEVIKKYFDILDKWSKGSTKLVVSIEELAGETR